jgi:hypothetical protein
MARAVRRWQPDLQVAKIVNDRTQGMRRDLDGRQRYRQLEAPPFRAAGIQIKHPIDLTDLRNVRMAGYNCVHSGCGRIEALRIPIYSGRVFRREAGHRSDLKPATIPK